MIIQVSVMSHTIFILTILCHNLCPIFLTKFWNILKFYIILIYITLQSKLKVNEDKSLFNHQKFFISLLVRFCFWPGGSFIVKSIILMIPMKYISWEWSAPFREDTMKYATNIQSTGKCFHCLAENQINIEILYCLPFLIDCRPK